jgi:hypothetical protein
LDPARTCIHRPSFARECEAAPASHPNRSESDTARYASPWAYDDSTGYRTRASSTTVGASCAAGVCCIRISGSRASRSSRMGRAVGVASRGPRERCQSFRRLRFGQTLRAPFSAAPGSATRVAGNQRQRQGQDQRQRAASGSDTASDSGHGHGRRSRTKPLRSTDGSPSQPIAPDTSPCPPRPTGAPRYQTVRGSNHRPAGPGAHLTQ